MKEKHLLPLAIVILILALGFNFYAQAQYQEEISSYYEDMLELGETVEEISGNAAKVLNRDKQVIGYAGLEQYNGFGGPMLVGVKLDDQGIIKKIHILNHKETPQYLDRISQEGFYDQYRDRDITKSCLTFGVDVDGITGATLSTRAIATCVDEIAESVRVDGMGLPASTSTAPWQFGIAEVVTAMIIAGAIVLIRVPKLRKYRLMFLIISVVGIGFWLNRPVTMAQISGIFMGYFPSIKGNLICYMLVIAALVPPILFGKNYYCTFICPFGAAQEVIGTVTKKAHLPLKGKNDFLRNTRNLIVFVALLVAFLFQNPSVSNFEPFAALFSLKASGIQWLLLGGVLGSAIFFRKFWCMGFCPVGGLLDLVARYRIKLFNKKKAGQTVAKPKSCPSKTNCGGCEVNMTKEEKRADSLFKFFYFIIIFSVVVAIFEKWSQL